MKVTLYGYWRSLATYRVRVALNLKGIDYEEIPVDLATGEQFSKAFSAINPQHALPLLKHDGYEISQSMAILEYIEELWPQPALLPNTPNEKAQVRALALATIADTHPLIVPRVRNFLNTAWHLGESEQLKWAQHWFNVGNQSIERFLIKSGQSNTYSFGDSVTIADIALASHAIGSKLFSVELSETPTFQKIFTHCMTLPAFANAHPLKQPGAPQSI